MTIITPDNTEEKPPISELINEVPELKLLFPYSDKDFEDLIILFCEFYPKAMIFVENRENKSLERKIYKEKINEFLNIKENEAYLKTIEYIDRNSYKKDIKNYRIKEYLRITNFKYDISENYEYYNFIHNSIHSILELRNEKLKLRYSYDLSESNEDKIESNSKIDLKTIENDSDDNISKLGYSTIWNNIFNIKNKDYHDSIREKFYDFRETLELNNKLTSKTRYENFLNLLTNGNFHKTSIIDWFDANDLKCFLDYLIEKKIFLQPRGVISNSKNYFTINGVKIKNLSNSARIDSSKQNEIKEAIDNLIRDLKDFI